MMSALTTQYGEGGLFSERHLAFYEERAKGEIGLIVSEQLSASPLSASCFAHSLAAYDARQRDRYIHIAKALQPHGTKFFVQLFSAGAAGSSTRGISPWGALRAPSRVPAPGGEVPSPLSVEEIASLVRDYAQSARRVREGNLHGVEIHGAHGWLVGQFLSPLYNKRDDQYGGTLENRCRLALEIGRAIRSTVGNDFPIGISLTYDEMMGSAAITPEETLGQLRVFMKARIFDFFDLSLGSSHQQHYTIGSMAVDEGITLSFAAKAKQLLNGTAAIFTSGRVVNVDMAGRCIAESQTDVIAMSRGLLADPYLLLKARHRLSGLSQTRTVVTNPTASTPEESLGTNTLDHERAPTTHCIGANYCVARALSDQPVTCVLNPAAGRELELPHLTRSRTSRRILVLGAGPAGLRFAMGVARQGHEVRVFEKLSTPGGHLSVLASLPTRNAWARAVNEMTQGLLDAGGELKLETELSIDDVRRTDADVIVIATGSHWSIPEHLDVRGSHFRPVALAIDTAIRRAVDNSTAASNFGHHTLILDCAGTYLSLGLADLLSSRGIQVTFVTPNESVGHIAFNELDYQHVMPRLLSRGMRMYPSCTVDSIGSSSVTLKHVWGSFEHTIAPVDSVVLSVERAPHHPFADLLRAEHPSVHCIGDCISPRSTAAVIYEAELLARSFATPAKPRNLT